MWSGENVHEKIPYKIIAIKTPIMIASVKDISPDSEFITDNIFSLVYVILL